MSWSLFVPLAYNRYILVYLENKQMARKGGNPETYFRAKGSESVTKTITVKVSPTLEAFVKSLPNRSEWIREAITEKAERERQFQSNG